MKKTMQPQNRLEYKKKFFKFFNWKMNPQAKLGYKKKVLMGVMRVQTRLRVQEKGLHLSYEIPNLCEGIRKRSSSLL